MARQVPLDFSQRDEGPLSTREGLQQRSESVVYGLDGQVAMAYTEQST